MAVHTPTMICMFEAFALALMENTWLPDPKTSKLECIIDAVLFSLSSLTLD